MQPQTRPVKAGQLDNILLRSQTSLQADNDLHVESSQLGSMVGSNLYLNDRGDFQGHYISLGGVVVRDGVDGVAMKLKI